MHRKNNIKAGVKPKRTANTARLFYLFISTAAAVGVLLLLLLILANVMTAVDIPEYMLIPITTFCACAATLLGGGLFSYLYGSKGLLCGFISALLLFCVLIIGSFLSGTKAFSSLIVLKFAVMAFSGLLGGYLGMNIREKVRRRH